ncbi:MAG: tetratricopeptide repeat protein [Candidatus Competibacteraceae bacterium]|nr:tetratricopeptide repeat protein [Candidatus Competibacteraceae bacterium]
MLSLEQKETLQILADVYLNQAQIEKAVTLLEALHSVDQRDAGVAKALSYAYLLAGRPEDALTLSDVFLRLAGSSPDSNPILLIRSKALWALGRAEEARTTINRYMELGGDV